jgi:putative N-acetylmannosamine-6-phosphate epimerase
MMNVLERWKAIWQSSKIGHLQKMMEIQEVAIADLQLQLKQERVERDEEIKQLLQQKMRSNEMLMAEIDKKDKLLRDVAAGLDQVHKQMAGLL